MSQADLTNRLNEAIALVRAGRRAEAHVMLLELSQQYPDLEIIWLWLATASDDTQDRINALQRVLAINPANEKARSALVQLTGSSAGLPPTAPRPAPRPSSLPDQPISPPSDMDKGANPSSIVSIDTILLIAVIASIVIVGAILLTTVILPRLSPTETPTSSPTRRPTNTQVPPSPTDVPTITVTPGGPTVTPFGPTEVPTWTASPTDTPAPTSTPVDTLPPLPTDSPTPTIPTRTPTLDLTLSAVAQMNMTLGTPLATTSETPTAPDTTLTPNATAF